MKRTEVLCPVCKNWIGWDYPATWDPYYGGDPGFYEGVEDFIDETGTPYCSQECLDASNPEPEEEDNG